MEDTSVQQELHFGSQCEMILEALERGESLTSLDALRRFGCFRLASRITDLKRRGHRIGKETIHAPNGKRYARYFLSAEEV